MTTAMNCDMGESFGIYTMGEDAQMMPLISLANVACGFHGSDPNHMRATVRLAKAHGVRVGAHPSLPDRQGFGRRAMDIGREELANMIIYQVGALAGFLEAEGMALNHIKPHGALYGMAARNEETAQAVCDAADVFGVPVLGMKNTLHEKIYIGRGHVFIAEYYADLDYDDDGSLIITREHGPRRSRDGGAALSARDRGGGDRIDQRHDRGGRLGLYLRALGYPERDRGSPGPCARRSGLISVRPPDPSRVRNADGSRHGSHCTMARIRAATESVSPSGSSSKRSPGIHPGTFTGIARMRTSTGCATGAGH